MRSSSMHSRDRVEGWGKIDSSENTTPRGSIPKNSIEHQIQWHGHIKMKFLLWYAARYYTQAWGSHGATLLWSRNIYPWNHASVTNWIWCVEVRRRLLRAVELNTYRLSEGNNETIAFEGVGLGNANVAKLRPAPRAMREAPKLLTHSNRNRISGL